MIEPIQPRSVSSYGFNGIKKLLANEATKKPNKPALPTLKDLDNYCPNKESKTIQLNGTKHKYYL